MGFDLYPIDFELSAKLKIQTFFILLCELCMKNTSY